MIQVRRFAREAAAWQRVDDLVKLFGRACIKRQLEREQLVQQNARTPHVGARRVLRAPLEDLGRAEVGRAEARVGARHVVVELLREAEVGELDQLALRDQDVGRLDVAVHDVVPVQILKAEHDLHKALRNCDAREVTQPQVMMLMMPITTTTTGATTAAAGAVAQLVRESAAVDELHQQVVLAAEHEAVDVRDDVRVRAVREHVLLQLLLGRIGRVARQLGALLVQDDAAQPVRLHLAREVRRRVRPHGRRNAAARNPIVNFFVFAVIVITSIAMTASSSISRRW